MTKTTTLGRVLPLMSTVVAAAFFVLTATSCGSTTSGSAGPGEIDVRELDSAKYPTRPIEARLEYSNEIELGRTLATVRLSDYVLPATDVDPTLRYGGWQAMSSVTSAKYIFTKAASEVIEHDKMVFGFAAGSTDNHDFAGFVAMSPDGELSRMARKTNPNFISVRVLQFPDDAAAAAAAASIDASDFSASPEQNQSVQLPNYPAAHTHWIPSTPTIGSTVAHGRYVVNLFIGLPQPDLDRLIDLTEKTYAKQLPLLEQLQPLTPEQVLRLQNDPDDILLRALNPNKLSLPDVLNEVVFGRQGFLHTRRDLDSFKDLYGQVGADRFGVSWGSLLIRTRDTDAGKTLLTHVIQIPTIAIGAAASPPNVPDSACVENDTSNTVRLDTKRFSCAVQYRRYVAVVESHQLTDAHQRAAAQYAVLANSQ